MSNNKIISGRQQPKIIPSKRGLSENQGRPDHHKDSNYVYDPKADHTDYKTGHSLYARFQRALKLNKTLFGFHFSGNYNLSKMDINGFLTEEEAPFEAAGLRGPHNKKRITGIKCN